LFEGVVVRTTGRWHEVESDGEVIPLVVRGKGRLEDQKSTNPVAVGDRVEFRKLDDGSGLIERVFDRRNKLSRRAAGRKSSLEHVIAANIDAVWVIQSVSIPRFNPGFVDRLLVMAGVAEIPVGVVINKIDLADSGELARTEAFWRDLYRGLDYPVFETCAVSGKGVDRWFEELKDLTSVIAGPSGVGKSTLLNALQPGLEIRTGDVSHKTRKGKHTTAVAERHEIASDTFVIDTPGIREIGLWDLQPDELYGYLPEMLGPAQECRFPNCQHDHEPRCGVKEAVDSGEITEERYASYLNMLDSLRRGSEDVGR
jgi:ribosome biogenesis GTPase